METQSWFADLGNVNGKGVVAHDRGKSCLVVLCPIIYLDKMVSLGICHTTLPTIFNMAKAYDLFLSGWDFLSTWSMDSWLSSVCFLSRFSLKGGSCYIRMAKMSKLLTIGLVGKEGEKRAVIAHCRWHILTWSESRWGCWRYQCLSTKLRSMKPIRTTTSTIEWQWWW